MSLLREKTARRSEVVTRKGIMKIMKGVTIGIVAGSAKEGGTKMWPTDGEGATRTKAGIGIATHIIRKDDEAAHGLHDDEELR